MNLEIINPLNYPSWDELLLTNKNYSFFHSSHWARVLSESYHFEPVYFAVVDDGKLLLAIPVMEIKSFLTGTKGVSLPFTDFCEPILSKNFREKEVWNALAEYGEKAGWKYIELRGGDGFGQVFQPSSWYYEHILDLLPEAQDVHAHFRNSTKRNIKKAQKAGVDTAICNSLDSIREFYRLNCLTRRMHGLPPQPFSFFKNIHKHIISKNHGTLILARYQEQPIAGSLYLHFGKKAIYKYGASDNRFQHLRPNNVVMWKAIKWYCQKGFTHFSFGITEPDHSGLRQFKKGWGAEEKVTNYYRYNFRTKDFVSISSMVNGWHIGIFKKMPIPFLRIVGSFLYKHMG